MLGDFEDRPNFGDGEGGPVEDGLRRLRLPFGFRHGKIIDM